MEQSLRLNVKWIKEAAEQCVLHATVCVKEGKIHIHRCLYMLEVSSQNTLKVGNIHCLWGENWNSPSVPFKLWNNMGMCL